MTSDFEEYEEPGGRPMDVDRILQGKGWDNPDGGGIFSEVTPESEDLLDVLEEILEEGNCTCDLDRIRRAAESLANFFTRRPEAVPRTEAHLTSLSALGGYAHGPWSMYVDALTSSLGGEREIARIVLFGCTRHGHLLNVVVRRDGEVVVEGELIAVEDGASSFPEIRDESGVETPGELHELIELAEERRYDDRTYGQLEEDLKEDDEGAADENQVSRWQEDAFPAVAVDEFLKAGLDLEEVVQLSRYMPLAQVAPWAETFGDESMLALEVLRISLGDLPRDERFEDLDFDDLRTELSDAIRNTVKNEVDRLKSDLREPTVKRSKGLPKEVFEIDDDFDDDDDGFVD